MRKFKLAVLSLIFLCLAVLPAPLAADNEVSREYKIKAAYLYNFAKFVEWPSNSFGRENKNFNICIVGENPFGKAIEKVERKAIGDRTPKLIRVTRLENSSQLGSCQMAFISSSQTGAWQQLSGEFANKPLLAITEIQGLGTINFLLEEDKVRFEINLQKAKNAGLAISARLTRIAVRVID